MFVDIDAVVAAISGCTMLDEAAERLGAEVHRVMGLDCIEVVTAAGTVMISNYYHGEARSFEVGYL